MKRITLHTFRQVAKAEEAMIRAAMPRTAAADPLPLPRLHTPAPAEVVASRSGSRLVRPLTYTIAEVANA